MNSTTAIRTGHSCAPDARAAAREFHAQVQQPAMGLVLFFCSSEYDLDALAAELNALFPGVPLAGCTTAGEIGPAGYRDRTLSGASFSADHFTAAAGGLDGLQAFGPGRGQAFAQAMLARLEAAAPAARADNSFAFLLVDGLSVREEPLASALQSTLGAIPLLGGSAADDLRFARTWVFHDGAFVSDAAVLVLARTSLPFRVFKTQHFVCEEERLVVTEADAARRVVKEINGLPAVDEYARLVGTPAAGLTPERFAAAPVVVVIDGTDYVRSIQKANPDGSLTFYCAIEEGLVLRVARGVDPVANLQHAFERVRGELGEPQAVLACDCILRNLEFSARGQKEAVAELFRRHNVVGFSTYGEQYHGVHINQTLTGIAFGTPGK